MSGTGRPLFPILLMSPHRNVTAATTRCLPCLEDLSWTTLFLPICSFRGGKKQATSAKMSLWHFQKKSSCRLGILYVHPRWCKLQNRSPDWTDNFYRPQRLLILAWETLVKSRRLWALPEEILRFTVKWRAHSVYSCDQTINGHVQIYSYTGQIIKMEPLDTITAHSKTQ